MLLLPNMLPGLSLAAWAVVDPSAGTIFKQSGNIASLVSGGSGILTWTFNAGVFADTTYVCMAPNVLVSQFLSINTKTTTVCETRNGTSVTAYVAGQRMPVFWYASP